MKHKFNRRAFRRAIWSSISRLIGVGLGAGAGSLVYQLIGGGFKGWGVASVLAVASFLLILFAEYEKEHDPDL
jgi:predicted MFS family arabinose efflux permease